MGLMVDQTEFKKELHALIDEYAQKGLAGGRGWVDDFEPRVEELMKKHQVHLKSDKFAGHLRRLILADNAPRAHRLVDVLEDRELSKAGAFALNGLFQLLRLGAFVLLILAVLWLTGNL